jgi:hypothetical protein
MHLSQAWINFHHLRSRLSSGTGKLRSKSISKKIRNSDRSGQIILNSVPDLIKIRIRIQNSKKSIPDPNKYQVPTGTGTGMDP